MVDAAIDIYRAALAARESHKPDSIRLLVTDDAAYDCLAAEVAAARGQITVFEQAARCDALLRGQFGWKADRPSTAMVLRDVGAVESVTLPDGLVLRPVGPLGVPLQDAVAVAIASDPGITETPDEFARYLSGLPFSVLLAAVDDAGVARATSGVDVFGEFARIFFVNTEPAWRRRGIGHAMTVEALRAAASAGARRAFLHATDEGAPVYLRVGFEVAGRFTKYSRAVGAPNRPA